MFCILYDVTIFITDGSGYSYYGQSCGDRGLFSCQDVDEYVYGESNDCVSFDQVCDGIVQCPSERDEFNCTYQTSESKNKNMS